jgi:acyl dehydratase
VKEFTGPEQFEAAVGTRLGTGSWLLVDQERIDTFARATGDWQWIHVDPQAAAAGPFGTTIAHGYLTLSLIPFLAKENYRVTGATMAVNYGLNRVRFINPVRVGSRIRAATDLAAASRVDGGVQVVFDTTIEIEGETRPACAAQGISRFYFSGEE